MEKWCVAIAALIGVSIFFLLFQQKQYSPRKDKRQRHIALAMKGTATLFATALALYGTILSPSVGNILLTAGLLICTAADVALGIRLLWGVAVFALGHVFYCVSFVLQSPPTWLNLGIFVLLFGISLIFLFPKMKRGAGNKPIWPFIAYGAVLFFMLCLAIGQSPVLLAGALLFVISDCMLSCRIFMNNKNVVFDYVCLGCYYLAQYLIALSILV